MSVRSSKISAAALALLAPCLIASAACLPERGKPPANKPAVAAAAAAKSEPGPKASSGPVAARAPIPPGTSGCEQAALRLAPGAVVGTINGAEIKVEDLGDQLVQAESKALRDYCSQVAGAREAALDNLIQQKVLTAAAEKAGKPINDYVQGRIDAEVGQPSDADVEAFYNARKSPETPALELVRDQVVAAINAEKSQKVFERILDELRAESSVEKRLPDVRPPPLQLDAPHTPRLGATEGAVVQVVEFSDFECPYCSRAADTLRELKTKYAGQPVQFLFRHFPLNFHPNARPAAEFAQCAHEQDKFWPMHDAIFTAQRELSKDKLKELAGQAGLDTAKLDECIQSGRAGKLIDEDMAKAGEAGVGGTPSFYINGQSFEGNPTPSGLAAAIDAELARLKG